MSLKSIFKDICKELDNVEHTSEKFVGVNDDWERFSMAYDVCRGYFERLKLKCTCKCNQRSATCRKEGNELFKNYSYWKALVLYNESIAFASNDSDELGFAYGNRASCLLRLHYPNEALQDIEKALSLCVSCTFKEKLLARKKQCLSEIKNLNHAQSRASFGSGLVPPLGRGKSLFFDSVSDVVELSHDEFWERKLIVNDNIRVGEVLIVEKPYSSVVLPDHFYTHCSKCFQRSLNLLPCSACSTTMFCSEECMSTANHVIECSYLEILSRLNAKGRELLSLKILIDASNQGKQLEKLYTEITKYNCGKNNGNCQFYSSMDFINIYNLVTNSDKRNTADLFYRSVISGVLILILEKCTNFFNSVAENRKEILKVFSGGLVLRFMQSLPCNAHEISEYYCANLIEVGAGAYATLSLINHSCDPNVVRYCCKNEIILRAIKPINRGEQVLNF